MHAHHIHLLVGDIAKEVYPLSPYCQCGVLLYGSRVVEVVYPWIIPNTVARFGNSINVVGHYTSLNATPRYVYRFV